MIQRIQSFWLLLSSITALLTLKFSFYSGNKVVNNVKQFFKMTGTSNFILMILTIAIGISSLILIFLFRDRKMQKGLTLIVMAASIGNIAIYLSLIKNYIEGNYDLTAILVFIIPILLFMAFRGIWKDERLVKNANRLR